MNSLRERIALLERREVKPSVANRAAALGEKLARIEAMVVASGDASDKIGASLIERTVRRYLRGEAEMGDALRDLLEGRWP